MLDREARRQQLLVQAVFERGEAPLLDPWLQPQAQADGLAAYRRNAWANAARALAAAHPVTEAMFGAEDFARLARSLWQVQAPEQGDWSTWGQGLPGWIADSESLAEHPYLADVARLDAACDRAERAADQAFDGASLELLATQAPEHLYAVLAPGATLIASEYPVVSLWQAHQADAAPELWTQARARLAAGQGELAWVWRPGWRAQCAVLPEQDRAWTEALLAGAHLAKAFERAGPAFDFESWLSRALSDGSLRGLRSTSTSDTP